MPQVTRYWMSQRDLDEIRSWVSEQRAVMLPKPPPLAPVSRYDLIRADYDFLEQGPPDVRQRAAILGLDIDNLEPPF